MLRKRVPRMLFVAVLMFESAYLFYTLQKLAPPETSSSSDVCVCGEDGQKKTTMADLPRLYILTPTYKRNAQIADMTRLSQTLKNVQNLHWVVVEDAETTREAVTELLERSGVSYTYLSAPRPLEYVDQKFIGRGVFNRREGLRWLRENAIEGVLYFADDDNSYDLRLFEQIRYTKKVSVFPVGMILSYGISSPIVKNGKVVGFHDAFQGGRKFALDMAGFAVNVRLLQANPGATIPTRVSYLEDGFLRRLNIEREDLEPLADGCKQVLVWHTRTTRSATPNITRIPSSSLDTNLFDLYRNYMR